MDLWTFPKQPLTSRDRSLRLVPLERDHAALLTQTLPTPGTWFYEKRGIRSAEDMVKLVDQNLAARNTLTRIPWLIRLPYHADEIAGISSFISPDPTHRQVEIGGTWIAEKWQRTFVNTTLKHLMLSYCFERLGCARVSFKVDTENLRSQQAVQRIGAQYEGELRHGWVFSEGRDRRNIRIYSILEAEWPKIKAQLESRLSPAPAAYYGILR